MKTYSRYRLIGLTRSIISKRILKNIREITNSSRYVWISIIAVVWKIKYPSLK